MSACYCIDLCFRFWNVTPYTLVDSYLLIVYQTTRHHIPEDSNVHSHRRENLEPGVQQFTRFLLNISLEPVDTAVLCVHLFAL
jgi:hypothetical protein